MYWEVFRAVENLLRTVTAVAARFAPYEQRDICTRSVAFARQLVVYASVAQWQWDDEIGFA
jgi:hypothetical protein